MKRVDWLAIEHGRNVMDTLKHCFPSMYNDFSYLDSVGLWVPIGQKEDGDYRLMVEDKELGYVSSSSLHPHREGEKFFTFGTYNVLGKKLTDRAFKRAEKKGKIMWSNHSVTEEGITEFAELLQRLNLPKIELS